MNFSKVVGYKVNIQKSVIFLYIRNEKSKSEIKETILCTSASQQWIIGTKSVLIHRLTLTEENL